MSNCTASSVLQWGQLTLCVFISWPGKQMGRELWCFLFCFVFFKWFYCTIYFFSALHPSFPLPFYSLPWLPYSQFTQEVFSISPSYLDPCMSLLMSSLLSRFSGVMNCRMLFLCFMSKATYEWVHIIFSFWVWVITLNMFFSRSIHLPENLKMPLFFTSQKRKWDVH